MSFCVGALALSGPNRDDLYAHNYCVVDFALRGRSSAPSTVPLLSTCCAKRRVQPSKAASAERNAYQNLILAMSLQWH
jgi:hypothetical protein